MGETLGFIAATLTTLSFLPQAVLTLRTRKTDEISFLMYFLFSLGVACWLGYGLHLANPALIVANVITLVLALPILGVKIFNMTKGGG